MKRQLFFLLVLLGLITACSDKNKLPKDVLSHAKMQAVMWDMIRAGDFLNTYVILRDTSVDKIAETQKWNEKIFQIHKITRDQFNNSYRYYQQHPQLMKAVMDSISKTVVEPPKPQTPSLTRDSIQKKLDSLKLKKKEGRFNRLRKRMPEVMPAH
ncbi:MAG: DUF4296 domain-containing protein [Chitinophagaceae bacterium]|nr:MAG: DUF4296 domain-containing protein [Chitinophagaceae bacterium]